MIFPTLCPASHVSMCAGGRGRRLNAWSFLAAGIVPSEGKRDDAKPGEDGNGGAQSHWCSLIECRREGYFSLTSRHTFIPVMRRLFAANVLVALLVPWITGWTGIAPPIVPCPMHSASAAGPHAMVHMSAGDKEALDPHNSLDRHHGSDHRTTARGCNCAGECGRSGATFALAALEPPPTLLDMNPAGILSPGQGASRSSAHTLPPATGPPQRLRT